MTTKHFVALADMVIQTKPILSDPATLAQWERMRDGIADVCGQSNAKFKRERWLGYIEGTNGVKGGKI